MKKIFSYLLIGFFLAFFTTIIYAPRALAFSTPTITGILSFKEPFGGGGVPLEDGVHVGDRSFTIQGTDIVPPLDVFINGVPVSVILTVADRNPQEIDVELPEPGAKAGEFVIKITRQVNGNLVAATKTYTTEPAITTPTPTPTDPPPPPGLTPTPRAGGTVDSNLTCTEQGLVKDANTGLCLPANPFGAQTGTLAGSRTIGGLIKSILDILLTLGGIVAILFIVIGGYQYVTSRGSESQAKEGRQTITYAIMGLVAILLAYMLVTVVTNLFTQGSLF